MPLIIEFSTLNPLSYDIMKTEIIKTERLTENDRKALYGLFEQYYENTNYDRFLNDLREKHWLIRMMDESRLAGFSTQQLIKLPVGKTMMRFLFSGDTIVHPDYWNRSHLAGAFGHLFKNILMDSCEPFYWFLISKGFRTYRFLPVFFKEYFPAHHGNNKELKPFLDAIALFKFPQNYNSSSGCIEPEMDKDFLNARMAPVPQGKLKDPHTKFFLQQNPEYRTGAELACIAPLTEENLTGCGKRVIRNTAVEWHV